MSSYFTQAKKIWKQVKRFNGNRKKEKKLLRFLTSLSEELSLSATWTEPSFEPPTNDPELRQLQEKTFSMATALIQRRKTRPFIKAVALEILACLTRRRRDLAVRFVDHGCLAHVFSMEIYGTEVVLIRNLLEDHNTLKAAMLLHIQKRFLEMEETPSHNNINSCDYFLTEMEPAFSRGPLAFLEIVASSCYLEDGWDYEYRVWDEVERGDPCLLIHLREKEATSIRYPEECSPNFSNVICALVDILLVKIEANQLVGATRILDLLGCASLVYTHALGVLVASESRSRLFYKLIKSLVRTSASPCFHDKVVWFLLVVVRHCKEGGLLRVMESFSVAFSELVESSAENIALDEPLHLLTFMAEALAGQVQHVTLPHSCLLKISQSLLKLLEQFSISVGSEEKDALELFNLIFSSLLSISNAWNGCGDSQDVPQPVYPYQNLFSFESLDTKTDVSRLPWIDPFIDGLRKRGIKLGKESISPHVRDQDDDLQVPPRPRPRPHSLLGCNDWKNILTSFLRFHLNFYGTLPLPDNTGEDPVQTYISLPVLGNEGTFLQGLLDLILQSKTKTGDATSDPDGIHWLLHLFSEVVHIFSPAAFSDMEDLDIKDISVLFRMLKQQPEDQIILILRLLSVATRASNSLYTVELADLDPFYKLFSVEFADDDQIDLASQILPSIIRSHQEHLEDFKIRLPVLVANMIISNRVSPKNLIARLSTLITVEGIGILNLDLKPLWGLLNQSVENLSGEETLSSVRDLMTCVLSFCEETHIDPVEFTTKHKGLLNELIREDRSLLDKSFHMLLKTPQVLDLPNKMSYFRAKMKEERLDQTLRFQVSRKDVFKSTFHRFANFSASQLNRHFMVSFKGEAGVDLGGLTREWFTLLSKEIIAQRDKDSALAPSSVPKKGKEPELFCVTKDSFTYQPNPMSRAKPKYYRFIGRLAGLALATENILDLVFTPSLYKHMLGIDVTYEDMRLMDPALYQGWDFMLNLKTAADVKELDLWFRDTPGIQPKRVTKRNMLEYLDLEARYYMTTAIAEKLEAFLLGFHELVPRSLVSIFSYTELPLVMSGMPTIDVEDLKRYPPNNLVIGFFWEALSEMSQEELSEVLRFCTGSRVVPADGLVLTITVDVDAAKAESLPEGRTCIEQLILRSYASKAILKDKLLQATKEWSFQLA